MRRAAYWTAAAVITCTTGFQAHAQEKRCHVDMIANLPVQIEGMRAITSVTINGHPTDLLLDSGAFFSIMSKASAVELGLRLEPLPPSFSMSGIGGTFYGQLGTAETFNILGHTFKSVRFIVGGSDVGNAIVGRNLLAMADTEFDLAHGSVKLMKPDNCLKAGMAYWAGGSDFFTAAFNAGDNSSDQRFDMTVLINGTKVSAAFDTGAPTSLMTRRAAERAGIDLNALGVKKVDGIGGFGRSRAGGWIVSANRIDIGDEGILKPVLMVIDGTIGEGPDAPEMLLGLDYMLSHHMYFSRGQRRIYFTYAGGTVFLPRSALGPDDAGKTAARPAAAPLPEGTQRAKAVTGATAEPKTATEFVTRGKFRLTQRDAAGALADFSKAIELEPGNGDHYLDRAQVYSQSAQTKLALTDLDKTISLEPKNAEALRFRAGLRFSLKDRTGALADAEAAAQLTPPSSLDSLLMTSLFEELGQPARAVPIYDAMIELHRDDSRLASLLNGRCWARALANAALDLARKDCDRAIKLQKSNAAYLDSRGLVSFQQKAYALAIADYDEALKIQPKAAWSLYLRGLSKIRLGQKEAGAADQAAALAIDPEIAEDAARKGFK